MHDQLYRGLLGYPVDEDARRHEVAQGVGGYTPPTWEDMHPYDMSGSDLYFPSPKEIEDLHLEIQRYLESGDVLNDNERPSLSVVVPLLEGAELVHDEFERRLEDLSETDKKFATATQEWVLKELYAREEVRGKTYSRGSNESYEEIIAVLDALLIELHDDEADIDFSILDDTENGRLISLVQAWRMETLAEVSVARLRELYRLAA